MNKKNLTALVALASTACNGWRVEPGPVPLSERAMAATKTQALRVRLTNGAEVFLVMARVEGDSLVGYSRDNRADFARAAYPVKQIQSVSTYGLSGARTAAGVLTAVGVVAASSLALLAVCAIAVSSSGGF